jgi:putative MFS transporter
MPFILVPLLNHTNATVLFSVVGLAMVLVAIDVAVLGPRTTGRTVEDLSD